MNTLSLPIGLFLLARSVLGQELSYLDEPVQAWTAAGSESVAGNGLTMAPDDATLVGTFADGSIRYMDANTGDNRGVGTYFPDDLGFSIRGFGGVTFHNEGDRYMIYAVTDNADSADATTRVIGINPDGTKKFESVPLPGVQAGTPLATSDGRYILMNSNVDGAVGYFTILDTTEVEDANIPFNYTYSQSNETNPFSPIGVFLNPEEGYYDGGQDNTNDMFVWAFDTAEGATTVGEGQRFGFQLSNVGEPLEYFPLGTFSNFQASTAPTLANQGRSMYWSVTRASQICWAGSATENANRFSRGRTEAIGLSRGSPQYIGGRASPTLSTDNIFEPTVFAPGASNEIFRGNYDYSEILVAETSSIISSKVAVSPDNQYIYYASTDGILVQASAADLTPRWSVPLGVPVESDIALNGAGTMLYVADTAGRIVAFQVADGSAVAPTIQDPTFPPAQGTSPTPTLPPGSDEPSAPTSAPVLSQSSAPTSAPVLPVPTSNTESPSQSLSPSTGTAIPTSINASLAPVVDPTSSPVSAPVPAPVSAPVSTPVTPPSAQPQPALPVTSSATMQRMVGALLLTLLPVGLFVI